MTEIVSMLLAINGGGKRVKQPKTKPGKGLMVRLLPSNWGVRTKLIFSFLLVIVIFMGSSGASYNQLIGVARDAGLLGHSADLRNMVAKLAGLSRDEYIYTADLIIVGDEQALEKYREASKQFRATVSQLEKEFTELDLLQLLNAARTHETRYERILTEDLLRALREGDARTVRTWDIELATIRGNIVGLTEKLNEALEMEQSMAMERIKEHLKQVAQNTLAGIIVALAIGVLVALAASSMIRSPLVQLVSYSRRMAEGDLAGEGMVSRRHDETGLLVSAFNDMRDALRRLIQAGADHASQVAAASEQLAASAGEVGDASSQVAQAVQEIARGSGEQAAHVQEAATAVSGLLQRVEEVTGRTHAMDQAASQVLEKAGGGNRAVADAVRQMEAIASQVHSSTALIENLGKRSEEVGQIVEVITGIAEQTNLLALNAAIEAARAGEQGRGFAVVAEEVRKLAEQSGQAAGRIAGMIREIQAETQAAVQSMEIGNREVQRGTRVIHQTGDTFEEINRGIGELAAHIQQLAALAGEMAVAGQQAGSQVRNIAAITEEATAGAEEVSSAMQQQQASIEEIAASTASLARMAEELAKTSARFKL